jgi:predicted TIM-barrel enzyme
MIGAEDVRVLANVTPGFSVPSVDRPLADVAKGAVFIGLADAVVVGGSAAGVEVDLVPLRTVAQAVPDTPIVVGTGAAVENVASLMTVADGFIVGSSIKVDRKTLNPIDPARAKAYMDEARRNA